MQVWQLGYYELVRPLGEGGMAQVYLGRDLRLGRDVAVKVLDEQLSERQSFRERFLREAQVAAALDHPNIVPIFDFGASEGHTYLVMPYVSGGSLQDHLNRAPMPPSTVAAYGSQMADALAFAHERGVVHRDVKPANMLLHADGRLMLADFGLAKILDGTPPRRPGRPDAGTPEYMAPEQIDGRTDERSDIYGLGVVLYLLFTGQLPFAGSTSNEVMDGHLYRSVISPRSLNPQVTPAMQDVLMRALAKDPGARFQRATELGAALMGALVAGNVEPPPFATHPPASALSSSLPLPPLDAPSLGSANVGAAEASWEPPQLDLAAAHSQVPTVAIEAVQLPRARSYGPAMGTVSYGPASGHVSPANVPAYVEQPPSAPHPGSRPALSQPAPYSQPLIGGFVPTNLASPVSAPLGQRPMLHGGDESRGSRVWTWVILGLGLAMIGLVALLILVLGRA
jgi:serine/threonine protein kinase